MSGDGLVHEVVNGLFNREEKRERALQMGVGVIPGGRNNALAKSLLDYSGETFSVENAAFLVAKGRARSMDITQIRREGGGPPIYACLGVQWAGISDIDIESESLKCCGFMCYYFWSMWRVMARRTYRMRI